MVNYDHVRQGAMVVRFYPTLWLFIIRVPYADVAVNDILHNDVVIFLDIFGALPPRLIHLQVSDILAVHDPISLVRADDAEVTVVSHHPLLELCLVQFDHYYPVHFIDQGLLIHWDLEITDLNNPYRK